MFEINGLDKLQRDLDESQKAFAELDGEFGTLHFDPTSPESIESAIIEMEALVDSRLSGYSSNPIVAPLIEGLKERYREAIIERASEARLGEEQNS